MGAHSSRKLLIALFAFAVGLSGCASAGGGASGGSRNLIVRAELAPLDAEELDGEQAVQRLRSLWLRDQPVVYADGARTTLDRYQADEIESIQYLDPLDAERRYGTGHSGGAIIVTTRLAGGGGGLDINSLLAGGGGGSALEQGETPRNTDNTRAADDALDAGEDADDPNQARMHFQQALAAAQAAITEDSRNPLAHRLAALANLELGDYVQAGEHFDQAQQLRPIYEFEDAGIREQAYINQYQAASPLLQQGAYEEAAVYLENADAVYHGRPEAKITLAQIYAALRDPDMAIQKMDEVDAFFQSQAFADIDDETRADWSAMADGFDLMKAQVLADAGRFEEAVVEYRALVAANPNDVALQQDLGAILMQMGETEQALDVYRGLVGRPGLDSDGLTRIGLGFYQADEFDEAAQALGRAAEVSPMDRDAIEWWARALLADSAFAEIPDVADRWVELDPQSRQGHLILAQAANMAGDSPRAAAAVQRVEALEFSVDNLQMTRSRGVGVDVSGAVQNISMNQGQSVTLDFTFYSPSGSALGTASVPVTVGEQGMNEVFQVQFDTTEPVGGYSYEVGG
jgi:tetratricopeptide (TPR) repeat protein